ncbi:MAG: hypothetical protein AAGH60_03250 [Pseudomonadota bacterium]
MRTFRPLVTATTAVAFVLSTFLLVEGSISQGAAQGRLLAVYQARISEQDHRNSQGDRLSTVAGILRQDRANFHRFDQADPEDEIDDVFTTAEERARFEQLVSRGLVRTDTRRAILGGNPLIEVSVYSGRVDVVVLER